MSLGIYLVETSIGSAVVVADTRKEVSWKDVTKMLGPLNIGRTKDIRGHLIGWALLDEQPRVVCVSRKPSE